MASDKCMGISTNPAAAGRAKSGGKIDAVSGTVHHHGEGQTLLVKVLGIDSNNREDEETNCCNY